MQTVKSHFSKTLFLASLMFASATTWALDIPDAKDGSNLVGADDVYTLVNLHPDESKARLYTVNYQMPGLIPVCSKVKINKTSRKAVKFEVADRGREYEYLLHKSLPEPFAQHLGQIFGKKCPKDQIAKMSKLDKEGIEQGVAKVGMSKAAVLIAMGPPPSHATHSLDANSWMYWQNRWGKLRVDFQNDKVSAVVN